MKKTISLVLCMSLIFASTVTCFARSGNIHQQGEFAVASDFEGVMRSSDGSYALEYSDNSVMPVGKLDINLSSASAVQSILQREDITAEVKEEISRQSQKAIAENREVMATLFSAELLPPTHLRSSTYYTYNGHQMRSDRLYTYGVSTGWEYLKDGRDTWKTANGTINLALTAVSFAIVPVSFLAAGKTVLDFFISEWGGSYAVGHTSDYLQMRLIYDDVKQWTYANVGNNWILGLCTQSVTTKKVGTEQYYFNGNSGRTTTKDVSTNSTQKSQHFNSPWATAWQYQNYARTEWIEWRVAGKTFSF